MRKNQLEKQELAIETKEQAPIVEDFIIENGLKYVWRDGVKIRVGFAVQTQPEPCGCEDN